MELIDSQLLRDTLRLPPSVGRGGEGENVKETVLKWRDARIARAHKNILNFKPRRTLIARTNLVENNVLLRKFQTVIVLLDSFAPFRGYLFYRV